MMSRTRAPVRIVIVQQDALVRDLLRIALGHSTWIAVAGVYDGADALLAAAADLAPDVAVIDVDLVGHNGIQLALKLRRILPELGIVLLVNDRDLNLLASADVLQRSTYFVNKSLQGLTTLLRAIQVTHARLLDLGDIEPLRLAADPGRSEQLPDLTGRQREILALLARGLTNKAIAATLRLKVKTIENQLASIYGKLQLEGDRTAVHPRVWAALYYAQAEASDGRSSGDRAITRVVATR